MRAVVESITEIRKKVQEPVRQYNDIAGLLVGDRLSIHITRFFIARGWSPTVATLGMLVAGLTGASLLPFGDVAAVAGFVLLVLYYVFDCVDGEVARYHEIEDVFWSFHDYLFHLYVKSAFFISMGIAGYLTTGKIWMFAVAAVGLVSTFLTKTLRDLSYLLANRLVLLRESGPTDRAYCQLTSEITEEALAAARGSRPSKSPKSYGSWLGKGRSVVTNFDLMSIVFLMSAIADLFLDPFVVAGMPFDVKILLFTIVTFVLAVDFLDRLVHHIRTGQFRREAAEMLVRAHHFRVRRDR